MTNERETEANPSSGREERPAADASVVAHGSDPVAELLPCPFCGSNDVDIYSLKDPVFAGPDYALYYGACTSCGSEGPGYELDTELKAAKAWNKRAGISGCDNASSGS